MISFCYRHSILLLLSSQVLRIGFFSYLVLLEECCLSCWDTGTEARYGALHSFVRSLQRVHVCMSTFRPEVQQAERMTDTGTRRVFSEEHDMFRNTVRKWWQKQVSTVCFHLTDEQQKQTSMDVQLKLGLYELDVQAVPYHDQWEEAGIVPRSVWEDAGSNQLLGLTMPEGKLEWN